MNDTPTPATGAANTRATQVPTPTPTPHWEKSDLNAKIEMVVDGLQLPIQIVSPFDNTPRLFVLEKKGIVLILEDGKLLPEPFLDIHDRVARQVEQALQGMVFAPDYATSGQFYVFYNRKDDGALVLERYKVSSNPNVADPASATEILTIPHPSEAHHGGHLQFGPDGYLYLSVGDGSDPTKGFNTNGQALDTLLGKILRIDVSTLPYRIPPANPFVNDPRARPEILAYGFRNPWRFHLDDVTGDLYIADVGENSYEEVNVLPRDVAAGKNFGWSRMEGTHCFAPQQDCQDGTLELPVFEYPHAHGCAIVGGVVYHGKRMPKLEGKYLFGDFCFGRLWVLDRDTDDGWRVRELGQFDLRLDAIVQAQDGNIYLLDYKPGVVYRLTVD